MTRGAVARYTTSRSSEREMSPFKALATVARLEYLPAEALLVAISVLLVLDMGRPPSWPMLTEGIFVFFLLYLTGFMVNAYADRDIDKTYRSEKRNIARSVDVLGLGLVALVAVQVLVAIGLTLHLTMITGNAQLPFFVTLGVFAGIGYSIEPLKFKTKGLAHGLALASSAFLLPVLFIFSLVGGGITLSQVIFATGFTVVMYSMEFGNQAMDYYEDMESGLATPTVRYSVETTLRLSLVMMLVGLLVTIFGLYMLVGNRLSYIHPMIVNWYAMVLIGLVLMAGIAMPFSGLVDLFVAHTKGPEKFRKAQDEVKHSTWQASGVAGVLVICILLLGSSLQPFHNPGTGVNIPSANNPPEVFLLNNNNTAFNVYDPIDFTAQVYDDGKIIYERWDFGDGSFGNGLNATHTYMELGMYQVMFTTKDDADNEVSQSINVVVTKLFLSKVDVSVKRSLGVKQVDLDLNVTNDKDPKEAKDLCLVIEYQGIQSETLYLDHPLKPALIWSVLNTVYTSAWEEESRITITLLNKDLVVEQRTIIA